MKRADKRSTFFLAVFFATCVAISGTASNAQVPMMPSMMGPPVGLMGQRTSNAAGPDQLDFTQIVQKAIQNVPKQERDRLAATMADQNLLLPNQALSSLTQAERDQLTRAMAERNIPLLRELNGMKDSGSLEPAPAADAIMKKIQQQVFNSSYPNIARVGQSTYMRYMQPQVVQSMIGSIRPWDFPKRFKGQMIPLVGPKIGEKISAKSSSSANILK